MTNSPPRSAALRYPYIVGGFFVLIPIYTFLLLLFKGLPKFAVGHPGDVFMWVLQSTWVAALVSGFLVAVVVTVVVKKTTYFHQPFDVGRGFSLGGIAGALAQIPATGLQRSLFQQPPSHFWMAGAMIAGFLAGATVIPLVFCLPSRQRRH